MLVPRCENCVFWERVDDKDFGVCRVVRKDASVDKKLVNGECTSWTKEDHFCEHFNVTHAAPANEEQA